MKTKPKIKGWKTYYFKGTGGAVRALRFDDTPEANAARREALARTLCAEFNRTASLLVPIEGFYQEADAVLSALGFTKAKGRK